MNTTRKLHDLVIKLIKIPDIVYKLRVKLENTYVDPSTHSLIFQYDLKVSLVYGLEFTIRCFFKSGKRTYLFIKGEENGKEVSEERALSILRKVF